MQLRVASLNVWALPWGLAPDEPGRMEAIAEDLASLDADVIGFQEVWTSEARTALLAGGRRAGFEATWHRSVSFGGSGLMVFSKLPILASEFVPFRVRGHPERVDHGDYHGGKGFVRLRLATASGPIQLIDTHLHARYSGNRETDAYLEIRTAQAVQIALALDELREPLIALGDFNVREGEPEYEILLGLTGLRDAAAVLDHRQPTITATNPYRTPGTGRTSEERIDYVFTRDGQKRAIRVDHVRRVFDEIFQLGGKPATYSDHAGVAVDLAIGGAPPASLPTNSRVRDEARQILTRGLQATLRRGQNQRIGGIAAIAGAIGGWSVSNRLTRRAWLRRCLRGAAVVGATAGAGLGWLGLETTPVQAEAYRSLLEALDTQTTAVVPSIPGAAFADREPSSRPTTPKTRPSEAALRQERT